MENYNNNIDIETGEVLEGKLVAKKPWSVRLEEETIKKLDELAEQQGLDKRELVEHFISISQSALFKKGATKGKTDIVEGIENKLDGIRRQMLELLEQNVEAEANIRDTVALEMKDLEDKIKSLQDKLNDQLTINKELKEEVKELKVVVQDKETAIKNLSEDHAATKDLNVVYKKQLEEFQVVKEDKKELEVENKQLQAVIEELRKQLSIKETEYNTVQSEVKSANIDLEKAHETIENLKSMHEKDIANIKENHSRELANNEKFHSLELEKVKAEVKEQAQDKLVEQMSVVQELTVKVAELEAANKEAMQKLLAKKEAKKENQ